VFRLAFGPYLEPVETSSYDDDDPLFSIYFNFLVPSMLISF